MTPTIVYNDYWRFAYWRQEAYLRYLRNEQPYTDDPILARYRFCCTYRAADRVSQYLIREIQYNPARSQNPVDVFFRTMLFKTFNKIETWEALERVVGVIEWDRRLIFAIDDVLNDLMNRHQTIYSQAYIMPSPAFGHARKHSNHLALLENMIDTGLPLKVMLARSFKEVYEIIATYPGIGKFLAFQYTLDLNYSTIINFSDSEFVVAGPGAVDGISRCFVGNDMSTEAVIHWMHDNQDQEFARLGLPFKGLFGRKLQYNDCQGLFCEVSKYARVAHPEIEGISGRTRIKQNYKPFGAPMPTPFFPPKWGLTVA